MADPPNVWPEQQPPFSCSGALGAASSGFEQMPMQAEPAFSAAQLGHRFAPEGETDLTAVPQHIALQRLLAQVRHKRGTERNTQRAVGA